MNNTDLNKQRRAVLEDMEKQFIEELIPARIAEGHEEAGKPDILTVLLENLAKPGSETLGEFFFIPAKEDDGMQVFENVLTLDDEVPEDKFDELRDAASILSSFIPIGAFVMDVMGRRIVYRHAYEMRMSVSDEQLKDSIDLCMGAAIQMVDNYGYLMMDVLTGERDAESVELLLKGTLE